MPPQAGVVEYVMTCHSGGTLEIYVEPFLPAPWLVVTGDSPIAEALATLGALDDFRVRRDLPADQGELAGGARYVVVAGLTGEDEHDLERALALDPSYVAFVGSRRRLGEVTARLRERGVSADLLARVKGPAGLDIGAVTAFEIAISIMAEIVQHRRQGSTVPPQFTPNADPVPSPDLPLSRARERVPGSEGLAPEPVAEAIDPVCGMRVAIPGARHVIEHEGQDHYFCCPSCRRLFAASPDQYRGTGSARALPSTGDGAGRRELPTDAFPG